MITITLVDEVLKGATTVEVFPSGAMAQFSLTGGDGYIGKDKFSYTSYIGTTLTGCSEISWGHEAGEQMYTFYGLRLRDVMPYVLLMNSADPDGVMNAIATITDDAATKYLKDQALDIHKNMDPNRADEDFLELICSNVGLEFNTDATEAYKRSLARQAVNLLKKRGTEAAFRFIVWHLLGYRVFVDYDPQKVIAVMGDQSYRMYTPATPMEISDKTVSYWKFEVVGTGPTKMPNEIATGPEMVLANAAMFTSTSMFPKMKAITLDLVHTWASAPGSTLYSTNLYGKEQFGLLWFMKPTVGGVYPQKLITKLGLIEITRPNATDLTIKKVDGPTSVTETIVGCTVEGENHFVAVLFDRPSIYVVVNDSIVLMKTTMDIDNNDPGNNWRIGDVAGLVPYEGRFDTFKIEVGKINPLECTAYYDHIKTIMTYGESIDQNSYMLCSTDKRVYITIDNGDGDIEKENTLAYLVEEWLTMGEYEILSNLNLPLEVNHFKWWEGLF